MASTVAVPSLSSLCERQLEGVFAELNGAAAGCEAQSAELLARKDKLLIELAAVR